MSARRWLFFRMAAVFAFLVTSAGPAMAQSGSAGSATVYRSPT